MKRKIIILIAFLAIAIFAVSCSQMLPLEIIDWDNIEELRIGWGDFHGGHIDFRIERLGDDFVFNAGDGMPDLGICDT